MKSPFYIWSFLLTASFNIQAQENPQKNWEELKDKTGWSLKRLDTLHAFLVDSTPVTGYMIIQRGKVVFQFGMWKRIAISLPAAKAFWPYSAAQSYQQ
jgi:predicted dithiol-disulfide oxidoreductase (DUF899 family)